MFGSGKRDFVRRPGRILPESTTIRLMLLYGPCTHERTDDVGTVSADNGRLLVLSTISGTPWRRAVPASACSIDDAARRAADGSQNTAQSAHRSAPRVMIVVVGGEGAPGCRCGVYGRVVGARCRVSAAIETTLPPASAVSDRAGDAQRSPRPQRPDSRPFQRRDAVLVHVGGGS